MALLRDFLTERLRPMIQACTLALEADKKARHEAEEKAEARAKARAGARASARARAQGDRPTPPA